MILNSVLFSAYCISTICFLKVPKIVEFRKAALKYTLVNIVIVDILSAIAIYP